MLKFLTSLSFLYLFTIAVLLLYSMWHYRQFTQQRNSGGRFSIAFFVIGMACLGFLWININAPLSLKSFSNLDHHFIRHEGFRSKDSLVLGSSDTSVSSNPFNRFVFTLKNEKPVVNAVYSEEPFYVNETGRFRLISKTFPAEGHVLSFKTGNSIVHVKLLPGNDVELQAGQQTFKTNKPIRKGIAVWELFRDHEAFINSGFHTHEGISKSLRHIYLLRSEPGMEKQTALLFFVSGGLFRFATDISYNTEKITAGQLAFSATIEPNSAVAWGVAFSSGNNNRFKVAVNKDKSLSLLYTWPRSYPLTEENRDNWEPRRVSKFLVSSSKDMLRMPAVFREGFMFQHTDSNYRFAPLLLIYKKAGKDDHPDIKVQPLALGAESHWEDKTLIVPVAAGAEWLFSLQNTYDWKLGSKNISSGAWQGLIFGSLGFFILLVLLTALIKKDEPVNWVWQLLATITLLLLTTRFFLYWRYKSFPPYEEMDIPSLQQLNSFWNFGIIILATVLLAIVFGFGILRKGYGFLRRLFRRGNDNNFSIEEKLNSIAEKSRQQIPLLKRMSPKLIFFSAWFLLLFFSAGLAAFSNYDPGVCRHLALGLVLAWFVFVYIAYRHSPLAATAAKSWWSVDTGNSAHMIISNPVKLVLSISLLAVFAFIDIGFSIVFLNFLLFNEAFLCINFAIAGLSAGSRRNAMLFAIAGFLYLAAFVLNLLFAPYVFGYLLNLPSWAYIAGYAFFAIALTWQLLRIISGLPVARKRLIAVITPVILFAVAFFFFPKEKIISKASMTKYRIDVLVKPADEVISSAYDDGKTYEPVIRAAQNQWFINTFIDERNNPVAKQAGFHLLPHAPQHKGAKYNAQATDLVASRFMIAEHGKWSVLLFVLLLLLPVVLLASFYKLYPDFTNRINSHYPVINTGFSILNYLMLTALLVTLAATGRYIFFGQDMPFASILSKQSIIFPAVLIVAAVLLFGKIPLEYYSNRKKQLPGLMVFAGLAFLLFFIKPAFNKNKEFSVDGLGKEMDSFVQQHLQPVMTYFDTAVRSKRSTAAVKDRLFSDSLRKMIAAGWFDGENKFFVQEALHYARSGFSNHTSGHRMIWLDLQTGKPQLTVNNNYFRVEPPPHLQQSWKGNVYGDSTVFNIALWNTKDGSVINKRLTGHSYEAMEELGSNWQLVFRSKLAEDLYEQLYLVNKGSSQVYIAQQGKRRLLAINDSLLLPNPCHLEISDEKGEAHTFISSRPDAFMQNYYVNGSRFYSYPLGEKFVWARNFAESIAADYADPVVSAKDLFVSLDVELMDSLAAKIQRMMQQDPSYKTGAEYGICIADGNGRMLAMNDFIKGFERPDPNDKARFLKFLRGEGGFVPQSQLRKLTGNINLLRLNPGPGSTLKPVVFAAIASQMDMDWDAFESDGFSVSQRYYGGERVAEYDFEKNNGRISRVTDYLRLSDNYYHSNVLLLGSYNKEQANGLLSKHFSTQHPSTGFHWPSFTYKGRQYWLNKFQHWPGYAGGKANFGTDSSFVSIGLNNNFGIHTRHAARGFELFGQRYDTLLFGKAWRRSGFILPEYALFDQRAEGMDHRIPYDLFTAGFRGHVKGSSQVMIPPVKMLEAFGKLVSQSRNYHLTLNPYAGEAVFSPFYVDNSIAYAAYLTLVKENIFAGMKEALFRGTAAGLGILLKNGAPYYYYAKTGTTGDNESTTKSKLLALVISSKDVAAPGHNFRNNPFLTVYFTSQNGPAKQNEAFQAGIIQYLQQTRVFKKYMGRK